MGKSAKSPDGKLPRSRSFRAMRRSTGRTRPALRAAIRPSRSSMRSRNSVAHSAMSRRSCESVPAAAAGHRIADAVQQTCRPGRCCCSSRRSRRRNRRRAGSAQPWQRRRRTRSHPLDARASAAGRGAARPWRPGRRTWPASSTAVHAVNIILQPVTQGMPVVGVDLDGRQHQKVVLLASADVFRVPEVVVLGQADAIQPGLCASSISSSGPR